MSTLRPLSIARSLFGLAAIAAALLAEGCSSVTGTGLSTTVPAKISATGSVHGGQQPVAGSNIQLYAVDLTTMQGAATPLLSSTVTTDANGFFTITGLYTCPANSLVYVVATGGNPGSGNNAALAMMAGIGACSSLTPSTFLSINELTTVAAAYALAPFMSDISHTGAAAANTPGIMRAFATAQVLVNTASGTLPGTTLPSNATLPAAQINTLADIMAACINSTGTTGACPSLFAATPSPTGVVPSDTIASMLNIARSPAANVAALFTMVAPSSPFQPMLATAPTDWTVAIRYSGGGLTAPHGIALDASGNVWIANEGALSVTKLSANGLPLSGGNGFTGGGLLAPQGIAIDNNGNAWIANTGGSSVVKLSSNGSVLSGASGFTSGVSAPVDIALDANGNAWTANFVDNSITKLNANGTVAVGPLTAGGLLNLPTSISLDPSGTVWVSSSGTGTLVRFSASGTQLDSTGLTDQYLQGPAQIALDANGRAFVASPGTGSVSAFGSNGAPLPASPLYGGGLNNSLAVATDGANTVWVANNLPAGSLTHLDTTGVALSPGTGFGALSAPLGLAIDATGSIWTANSGDNSVSQFVGIATPVSLPLSSRTH